MARALLGLVTLANVLVLATAPAFASVPLPDSLADYVVLGSGDVDLGKGLLVTQGGVGANDSGSTLILGRDVSLPDGSPAVGDHVEVGRDASIFDLFANSFELSPGAEIRGIGPLAFTPPVVAGLPSPPSFAPGTEEVRVGKDEVLDLEPGAYGEVVVARRGTLVLSAGTYEMESFRTGRLAKVLVTGPVTVNVADTFKVGHLSAFGPSVTGLSALDVDVNVVGEQVRLGPASHVSIDLLALGARVRLGRSFHGTGRYVGKDVVGAPTMNLRTPSEIGLATVRGELELCTLTQAEYGAAGGAANGPDGLVTDNEDLLPVRVGATGVLSLTIADQDRLICFLPADGTAAALCEGIDGPCEDDMVIDDCASPPIADFDPSGDGSSGGQGGGRLAGELIAAKLNVALSERGETPPGLGDLVLPRRLCTTVCPDGRELDPNPMEQQIGAVGVADGLTTVADLLAFADQALGSTCAPRTCAPQDQAAAFPPNPVTREGFANALAVINECFAGCATIIPCDGGGSG
jgi:hypothetical protein